MKVWLGKVISPGHNQLLCCAQAKGKGERRRDVDARRNYSTSKVIMLFVCGCFESELCLWVIRGVIIPLILLKTFHKRKQTERNGDKHTRID